MSILDNKTPKPMAVAKVKGTVIGGIRQLYARMVAEFTTDFALIWHNPDGLTPAEALAALGTDAAEVFTLAGILKTALNSAKLDSVTTPTPDVVFNPDGTVTLK